MSPRQSPLARYSLGLDLPPGDDRGRRVFPFRRSWIAILIAAAATVAMAWPAVSAIQEATRAWHDLAGLDGIVTAAFLGAWALGWSVAPLALAGVLTLMVAGREVVRAGPGRVEIGVGIPGLVLSTDYDPAQIRNLRMETPAPRSGLSWRGPHLVFDYGSRKIDLGSAVTEADLGALRGQLEQAAARQPAPGPAGAREDAAHGARLARVVARAPAGAAVRFWSPSTLLLVAANLVPIFGAAFLGWRLGEVMVLYWAESAVIGFWNLVKMAVIGRWQALLAGPFFVGHFGAFMSVHFLFLYTLFIAEPFSGGGSPAMDSGAVLALFRGLAPALAALFISHGISFFTNFIGRREYLGRTVRKQMMEPYRRIVFMQLVIILGGWATMLLGDSAPVLVTAIVVKIVFDVRAHLKERTATA